MTHDHDLDKLALTHQRLTDAVDALLDAPAWRTLLTVAARCHRYSPSNLLLIASQRRDATYLLGYAGWRKVGRQVRAGERGIAILAPVTGRRRPEPARDQVEPRPAEAPDQSEPAQREDRSAPTVRAWRVAHVFDIAQTDGPDLATSRPVLLDGEAPPTLFADLAARVRAAGYAVGFRDVSPANGVTDHGDRTVVVRPDLPAAQQVKTLAHELAHCLLHAPGVRPDGMSRARAEVEAESVAYVVSAAHGLKAEDYTVPYVTGWAGGNRDLVASTATRVLACARDILTALPPPGDEPADVATCRDGDRRSRVPGGHDGRDALTWQVAR